MFKIYNCPSNFNFRALPRFPNIDLQKILPWHFEWPALHGLHPASKMSLSAISASPVMHILHQSPVTDRSNTQSPVVMSIVGTGLGAGHRSLAIKIRKDRLMCGLVRRPTCCYTAESVVVMNDFNEAGGGWFSPHATCHMPHATAYGNQTHFVLFILNIEYTLNVKEETTCSHQ